jgi:hypothetical protein
MKLEPTMLKVNPGPFCSLLLGEMADTAGVRFTGGGGGGEIEEVPQPLRRNKLLTQIRNSRGVFVIPPQASVPRY